jgi:hypothetical protein
VRIMVTEVVKVVMMFMVVVMITAERVVTTE